MTSWTLENSRFSAEIAQAGGELTRLWDKRRGVNALWTATPKVWNSAAPQLFPVVGRLIHQGLWIGDRFCALPAHGFLRHQPFLCLEHTHDTLRLEASATPQTQAVWPYRWRVRISFKLDEEGLSVSQCVVNEDDTTFAYSLGWHPGLALPVSSRAGWCVDFGPGPAGGPFYTRDRTLTVPDNQPLLHRFALTETTFQGGAVYFGVCEGQQIAVRGPDGTLVVKVETFNYPWLALWGIPGEDLLCIEPLAGTTDAPDFDGQAAGKRGMQRLLAGQQETFRTRLRFAVDA
ncbi:aldose epimerase [Enterobacteriaceae bacterium 155047]|uniref:aldose epimerase family protein n=1 Tax=Huaxiibacter chinensis TaxID=2899785 RepID=UPI0007DAA1FA|nr:aldose epimerase [Huaxiibacter chinensis]ANG92495.1 aldose epimerase [Lelliottia amnigena]MCG5042679.1 aldose epimerase [Huaxiibacter chinensis]